MTTATFSAARRLAAAALLCLTWSAQAQIQGTPPDITFIDFPARLAAAEGPRVGRVYFRDAERDVVQAEFSVVEAESFEGFILDVAGAVQSDGVFQFFEFSIAPEAPQRVTLAVVLVDAEGLRSPARRFSFEVTGSAPAQAPAAAQGQLAVEPAALSFEARAGGAPPPGQALSLRHSATQDFAWTARANVPWLTLSAQQGRGPAEVGVRVTLEGLSPGVRLGQITFQSSQAATALVVSVALSLLPAETVAPSEGGRLVVLAFEAVEFDTPADWVFELKDGCTVHTNVGTGPSALTVEREDGSREAFAVPVGNQVVVCGRTVLVDTRR